MKKMLFPFGVGMVVIAFLAGCASGEPQRTAKPFGYKVRDSFLHVGGELEEFFTGDRTVDR